MIRRLLCWLALAGSSALLDCSPTQPKELCGGPIAVSVANPRGSPFFRWSGGCGVTDVIVSRDLGVPFGGYDVMWGIQALDERAPVGAPIWYGVVPPGARTFGEPSALEQGVVYRVVVTAVVGGDAAAGSGEAVFTH